jgi:hypothetical protein
MLSLFGKGQIDHIRDATVNNCVIKISIFTEKNDSLIPFDSIH